MTNQYDELINVFASNLRKLISEYESLKVQNFMLKKEIELKDNELKSLQQKVLELQEKINHFQIAKALAATPEESSLAKQQLSKMVREIDKCLALLLKE